MIRVFWLELRHSALRWWLVPLMLVDVATVFGRDRWWIGVWPQASAAAQIPAFFLGPFLAAGASWMASRSAERGMPDRLAGAAVAPWRFEAVQLAATLAYGLVAYFTGTLLAAAVSIPAAGPGFLWPGYQLLGAGLIIGCAAAGHAAGRLFPSRIFTPAVSALGTLLLIASLGNPRAFAFFVLVGDPQVQTGKLAVAVRVGAAVSLAFLATLVPGILHRGQRRWQGTPAHYVAAFIAASLALVTTFGILSGGPLQVARAAPDDPLCSGNTPKVCVWPEDRKYLPEIVAMVGRIRDLPTTQLKIPSTFFEYGLRDSTTNTSDFRIVEGSTWSVSPSLAGEILQLSAPWCPTQNPSAAARRDLATWELSAWLEARMNGTGQPDSVHGGPPGVDLTKIASLIKKPETEQAQWLTTHIRTIRETPCDQ